MSLLDGGLQRIFGAAFSSIYLPATLHIVMRDYAANGDVTTVEINTPVRAHKDAATESMRRDPGYTGTDVAIFILQDGVATAPTTDHEITLQGERWGIGSVTSDAASTHWIVRGVKR